MYIHQAFDFIDSDELKPFHTTHTAFRNSCYSTFCSFYNWETQTSTSNPTPNYQVIAENASGLLFKNKRDRKILNVDPKSSPGDNSTRVVLDSPKYTQIVIYDHITRRKT